MASISGQAGLHSPPVTGRSGVLGVFGYPVEHSLSPTMHNAAIAALGLHYIYIPFSIRPDDIGPAIRSLSILGIIGVNLTIPHKERVLPFLDEVDPEAQAVGAVNTVRNLQGRLIGYNTDGEGFFRSLSASGFAPREKRVVVVGAGGAARSVVYRLLRERAQVVLANRTLERAQRLAREIGGAAGGSVEVVDLGDAAAVRCAVDEADLLVNTTSVGMCPNAEEDLPVPVDSFHSGLLVYDLVYNPPVTRLMSAAEKAGGRTLNGASMLAHQGAAAFEIWTGIAPPVDVMRQAVERGLLASDDY